MKTVDSICSFYFICGKLDYTTKGINRKENDFKRLCDMPDLVQKASSHMKKCRFLEFMHNFGEKCNKVVRMLELKENCATIKA